MSEKILFVDDEPNVLQSIKRTLRKKFVLDTASSGSAGLEAIAQNGPYAVIVSDMQMPQMSGAQFLGEAKRRAPGSVRMMLTGNADQQTAIDAINQGDILRFLNKPVSTEQLTDALEAGLTQYRLINAEKELLRSTLHGSIQALADVLALGNPEVFGRNTRIKLHMSKLAVQMGLSDVWQYEALALLAHIGSISLPAEIATREAQGARLSIEEYAEYASHAGEGADILDRIPRIQTIADSVRYQGKYFDGSGTPDDALTGSDIPLGSRMLRAVLDLDRQVLITGSADKALTLLQSESSKYDPDVLSRLRTIIESEEKRTICKMSVAELTDDMQLACDIFTVAGTLLVAKGQNTTQSVRRHLRNYWQKGQISNEVSVWAD